MKAGRYALNGSRGLFLVRQDQQLVDWRALDHPPVPPAVKQAVTRAINVGDDASFCAALPVLENFLAQNGLRAVVDAAPALAPQVEFESPVQPRNFICTGLNYRDHAAEASMPLPDSPLLFAKTANAVTGHNRSVAIPVGSEELDYEAELAVVISKTCRRVKSADALSYVAGYTCGNDITARDFQFSESQWYRGKSADGFGPLGPWIVTPGEAGNGSGLRIQLRLNGQVMQDSNTANLIFDVPALIEYVSRYITLEAGDVILTGTPGGVGFSRKPPIFLQPRDRMEVEIEHVGTLVNEIQA
jgi:2-keto-4-pentenoate hydratase/2-oxohepta-3-ene-1,7-dioic acid hydratase in catechol pathway